MPDRLVLPIDLRRPLLGRAVGVLGLGVSGLAMARVLHAHGATLTLADDRPASAFAERMADFPGARWALGGLDALTFAACEAVLCSPGIDPRHVALAAARARGQSIGGELTLLPLLQARLGSAPRVLAITGTNGKSTTTALCGALVAAAGTQAFVGGNLGEPIGAWLQHAQPERHAVLELSSYQIDGMGLFAPDVAAVLNVEPDHLARYGTLSAYAASKARLVAALPATGVAVLNADDGRTRAMASACAGRTLWFTQGPRLPASLAAHGGLVLQDDVAVPTGPLAGRLAPLPLAHPVLLGPHNRANAMAALLCAHALQGAPSDAASPPDRAWAQAYLAFEGLPHRLAPVACVRGVRFIDDSKATNDASAATAVRAMAGSFVLLVGGQDKGGGYAALQAALGEHPPRAVLCFGAAAPVLAAALEPALPAGAPLQQHVSLESACAAAAALARPGDVVLMSPACASFDAFADYRARGAAFAAWVRAWGADVGA